MKVEVSISTMALKDSQDFAASHALHLRDAVGVTEDDTNLGRGEPLFRQLADMVLNLKVERNGWGSSEVSDRNTSIRRLCLCSFRPASRAYNCIVVQWVQKLQSQIAALNKLRAAAI